MAGCQLCSHPNMKRYEQQIWLGKISAAEVAKMMQVSEETLWRHLREHKTQTQQETQAVSDLATELRNLKQHLAQRCRDLLALPVDPLREKDIATPVRLLKDLVMDIAKLEHHIESVPTIQIQQVMVQMTEVQNWLLENLCEEDKQKFLRFLELKIKPS